MVFVAVVIVEVRLCSSRFVAMFTIVNNRQNSGSCDRCCATHDGRVSSEERDPRDNNTTTVRVHYCSPVGGSLPCCRPLAGIAGRTVCRILYCRHVSRNEYTGCKLDGASDVQRGCDVEQHIKKEKKSIVVINLNPPELSKHSCESGATLCLPSTLPIGTQRHSDESLLDTQKCPPLKTVLPHSLSCCCENTALL